MILELRKKTPFISFSFNTIERTGFTNEVIDVYLRTIYNQDVYKTFEIGATGATVKTIVNNYHYQLEYDSLGVKNISITIEKGTPLQINSNTLNLEIICRNNLVFSDPCNSQYIPIL